MFRFLREFLAWLFAVKQWSSLVIGALVFIGQWFLQVDPAVRIPLLLLAVMFAVALTLVVSMAVDYAVVRFRSRIRHELAWTEVTRLALMGEKGNRNRFLIGVRNKSERTLELPRLTCFVLNMQASPLLSVTPVELRQYVEDGQSEKGHMDRGETTLFELIDVAKPNNDPLQTQLRLQCKGEPKDFVPGSFFLQLTAHAQNAPALTKTLYVDDPFAASPYFEDCRNADPASYEPRSMYLGQHNAQIDPTDRNVARQ